MLVLSDPYKVLQVDPEADPEVIRAAYRRLAQKHHPDYGGSDQRMAELNAAYSVLRDATRRASYDAARRRVARGPYPVAEASPAPPPSPASAAGAAGDAEGPLARARAARIGSDPGANGARSCEPGQRVLDFGRYAGWSIGEIARTDPDFLEWLERMPIGRQYRADIQAALTAVGRVRDQPNAAAETGFRLGAFQRASQVAGGAAFGRPRRLAFLRR